MKPHSRIRKAIKWGGAAVTVLILVLVLLTTVGCGGPKWNQYSKTVDQSAFIADLHSFRTFGSYWRYGGFYNGFHYLEYWQMYQKSWAEYHWSVRSQGERVDEAVALYLLKNSKQ